MLNQQQIPLLVQATAYDLTGDKIGAVKQVYLDDRTDEPQFATVHTGLFGLKESFVPLTGADLDGDRVIVPVEKAKVQAAPSIDPDGSDGALTPTQVAELHRHYGLPSQPSGTRDAYRARAGSDAEAEVPDGYTPTSAATGEQDSRSGRDDDAMTRSEERLNVGTVRKERIDTDGDIRER